MCPYAAGQMCTYVAGFGLVTWPSYLGRSSAQSLDMRLLDHKASEEDAPEGGTLACQVSSLYRVSVSVMGVRQIRWPHRGPCASTAPGAQQAEAGPVLATASLSGGQGRPDELLKSCPRYHWKEQGGEVSGGSTPDSCPSSLVPPRWQGHVHIAADQSPESFLLA